VISLQFDSMLSLAVGFTGHEETFWGRVALWKGLLNMSTNPLLGSGFESFWLGDRLAEIWENYWWHPNQAHNGYIEIYLNLGLIGLFLLIGVIVSGYKKICKVLLINFDYGRFQMAFLIIATIYNITEAAFKGLGLVWFIFLTIAVECPRPVTLSGLLKTPEFGGDEKIDDR
ncbi:MAG: O-antigen ligase family protein, partial [Promethearchaeota archaeon]